MTTEMELAYTEAEKTRIFQRDFEPLLTSAYNFAFRLTLDEDDAKDLVQDSYLRVFRFMDSYKVGTNAKAWLFRIVKNTFINEYRRKTKEPNKIDYQDLEQTYNAEEAENKPTTDLRVDVLQGKIGDEVANALNSLAVDFRTVIVLCDLEGFTYEEMAKILDIPIGTVRSRLHRARYILKEKLTEYARQEGYIRN
ncbi:MAG: sigma-70 family RNA polymerase sigma factor [Bacteroidetes bacterium]|nr:MAG: sigma-70 family RNA polymerase sigma factor [Bacteroidota bacterium]